MKFSIKDFFSKYDQISSFLQILLHLLKKSLIENFIFCALNLHYEGSVITNQSHISWLFTKNTKQTKNTLSANFSSYSKDHHFISTVIGTEVLRHSGTCEEAKKMPFFNRFFDKSQF